VTYHQDHAVWPELPYEPWKDTLDTVHMWLQVAGKIKLALSPYVNEWWHVALSITARGVTTRLIPYGSRSFQIDFDFIHHRADLVVSDGSVLSLRLEPRSVADFYRELMDHMNQLGLAVAISREPSEVEDPIRFDEDHQHDSYDAESVTRWWQILLNTERVLARYRTGFVGKNSPILLWWGALDISQVRFSGRPSPAKHWPTRWMRLAADHEQASAGFWPGDYRYPAPAFFAYTAPEPEGCRSAQLRPEGAIFHPDLSEFILPYEAVRGHGDPAAVVLEFYESAYNVGANLAGWDRQALEGPQRSSNGELM
jgi:hypothetical protein